MYYQVKNGQIVSFSDFKYADDCLETDKNIVYDYMGRLCFEEDTKTPEYQSAVADYELSNAKQSKKHELKYERDKREVAVIAYKGKTFDYDDKARERLNIARQALEDNNLPSQMWTCADNTDIELTVEDFKNINSLAAQRSGQLHDTYRKLCDYIDKLKTADEVNAVTFDTAIA